MRVSYWGNIEVRVRDTYSSNLFRGEKDTTTLLLFVGVVIDFGVDTQKGDGESSGNIIALF